MPKTVDMVSDVGPRSPIDRSYREADNKVITAFYASVNPIRNVRSKLWSPFASLPCSCFVHCSQERNTSMHQRQLLLLKVTCCTVLFLLLPVLGWSPTAFASEKSPMAPNIIPVGSNTADGAPSLWNFGGILYLAWTGTDAPSHLYIIQATQSGSGGLNFVNQRQINDTTMGGFGPTLASFNGQ